MSKLVILIQVLKQLWIQHLLQKRQQQNVSVTVFKSNSDELGQRKLDDDQ